MLKSLLKSWECILIVEKKYLKFKMHNKVIKKQLNNFFFICEEEGRVEGEELKI